MIIKHTKQTKNEKNNKKKEKKLNLCFGFLFLIKNKSTKLVYSKSLTKKKMMMMKNH